MSVPITVWKTKRGKMVMMGLCISTFPVNLNLCPKGQTKYWLYNVLLLLLVFFLEGGGTLHNHFSVGTQE